MGLFAPARFGDPEKSRGVLWFGSLFIGLCCGKGFKHVSEHTHAVCLAPVGDGSTNRPFLAESARYVSVRSESKYNPDDVVN